MTDRDAPAFADFGVIGQFLALSDRGLSRGSPRFR